MDWFTLNYSPQFKSICLESVEYTAKEWRPALACNNNREMPATRSIPAVCLAAVLAAAQASAQESHDVSEADYFNDVPVVLSVSRMPQRIDEAPGAVTIIDRDMIRHSGARDVADLMRLVPGFQSSMSFQTIAPQATYHGGFGIVSNRIQVLVDGRSVYSPFFLGSVEAGLQSVALQDIERIEVLRGSNSAAYGARAFLGVINIVTMDSADTVGSQLRLSRGSDGIQDTGARIGGALANATYRLSLDRRADDGLEGAYGQNQIDRVGFRADLRFNARDEVQLRAGTTAINANKGFQGNIDAPARATRYGTGFVQLDWRRGLDAEQDLALSYSHSEESYQDKFPYSLAFLGINSSIDVDTTGRAGTDNLSLQHTWRQSTDFRLAWGVELRREQVTSRPIYNTDAALVTDFARLFANGEWRPAKDLVLNVGAMAERSSVSGVSIAPRSMLNWHFAEGQTLRAGVSRAFRPASAFEESADMRYYWNGQLLRITTQASGQLQPESLNSSELGYYGTFSALKLQLDVRVFRERIGNFILQANASVPRDYVNLADSVIRGFEYELKWQPWTGGHFRLTQANIVSDQILPLEDGPSMVAPKLASTLTYVQQLPHGLDLSVSHQDGSRMALPGAGLSNLSAVSRTDLRLAGPLRFGAARGELALVVQNLRGSYPDYAPSFAFQRRAFVTFQIAI
jgi:iron complex outermembrane recepter protein